MRHPPTLTAGPPVRWVLGDAWLGLLLGTVAAGVVGGPIRILRALTPKIEGDGAVLFITSSSVRQPIPNLDTSNILRPGVAAMAKVLARELGPRIRVNSLAPGRFDTDRVRTLDTVSYTHLRAHETVLDIVCRLLLEKKNKNTDPSMSPIDAPSTLTSLALPPISYSFSYSV